MNDLASTLRNGEGMRVPVGNKDITLTPPEDVNYSIDVVEKQRRFRGGRETVLSTMAGILPASQLSGSQCCERFTAAVHRSYCRSACSGSISGSNRVSTFQCEPSSSRSSQKSTASPAA